MTATPTKDDILNLLGPEIAGQYGMNPTDASFKIGPGSYQWLTELYAEMGIVALIRREQVNGRTLMVTAKFGQPRPEDPLVIELTPETFQARIADMQAARNHVVTAAGGQPIVL